VEAATPRAHASSRSRREPEAEDLTDYCSRPNCRKGFQRAAGPVSMAKLRSPVVAS
jgi:hypothetical protein